MLNILFVSSNKIVSSTNYDLTSVLLPVKSYIRYNLSVGNVSLNEIVTIVENFIIIFCIQVSYIENFSAYLVKLVHVVLARLLLTLIQFKQLGVKSCP